MLQTILTPSFELISDALEAVKLLVSATDLYLITVVSSDEEEERARAALQAAVQAGVNATKLLFCSTSTGKSSMIRQLEPAMHIDDDGTLLESIQRFVPRLLLISLDGATTISQPHNMQTSSSLRAFFTDNADDT